MALMQACLKVCVFSVPGNFLDGSFMAAREEEAIARMQEWRTQGAIYLSSRFCCAILLGSGIVWGLDGSQAWLMGAPGTLWHAPHPLAKDLVAARLPFYLQPAVQPLSQARRTCSESSGSSRVMPSARIGQH